MSTRPQLKPCPFCGDDGRYIACMDSESDDYGRTKVGCLSCWILTYPAGEEDLHEICETWNQRVNEGGS